MVSNAIDLTGKRFGYFVVLERFRQYRHKETYYKCQCDCGKIFMVRGGNLNSGHTKSCGCQSRKMSADKHCTHRMTKSQIYRVWSDMKNRTKKGTYNNKSTYKSLNIKVCEEWKKSFIAFYEWSIKNGYTEEKTETNRNKLTIDRIDPYGDYCPENCRWVDMKEQGNNRTHHILVEFNGKTQTLSQWADGYKIPYKLFYTRYRVLGWDIERIINTPVKVQKKKEKQNV